MMQTGAYSAQTTARWRPSADCGVVGEVARRDRGFCLPFGGPAKKSPAGAGRSGPSIRFNAGEPTKDLMPLSVRYPTLSSNFAHAFQTSQLS